MKAAVAEIDSGRPTAVLVGDSIAYYLYPALAQRGKQDGLRIEVAATPSCGVAVSHPLTREGRDHPWSKACAELSPQLHALVTAMERLDSVIWISGVDQEDQLIDGRHVRFASDEGEKVLLGGIERMDRQLTNGRAALFLVTIAPRAATAFVPADLDPEGTARRYNQLLAEYAAARPGRVHLLDLAALICPSGPPCPEVWGAIRMRPDGLHFGEEGAQYVADWLVSQMRRLQPALASGP